ncbi:MAG: hypothetical protein BGO70_10365 [Bacteroidetes bacterium 43-93]|nr:MAG: hypothetical protein BGO70_10365 [Bacteroidetes bacterium 43-93]
MQQFEQVTQKVRFRLIGSGGEKSNTTRVESNYQMFLIIVGMIAIAATWYHIIETNRKTLVTENKGNNG